MAITISIAAQKGGVGKSTIATIASSFFSLKNYHTLLIDTDPQANGTDAFLEENPDIMSLKEVIMDSVPLSEVIKPTKLANLDIVPANISLAKLDKFFILETEGIYFLKDILKDNGLHEKYDYIFFDCPPSLGMTTTNALVASDFVVIPVECKKFSVKGVIDLQESIDYVKRRPNPNLRILGAFINRYLSRRNVYEYMEQKIREHFGDLLFNTIVRETAQVEESMLHRTPIFLYSPKSNGSQDFGALCHEMFERIKTMMLIPSVPEVV